LKPEGTSFQKKVWDEISKIPKGNTLEYGQIAKILSSSPRAVGQACGSNPIPLVIPCHRVVSKSGLGGFMHHSDGSPISVKKWLLSHESD
jgi:methylated-DNA-[protein]-cysteine S-methyltransferase